MSNRVWTTGLLCAVLVVGLGPHLVIAQDNPHCPPAPRLEASSTSIDTKTALDAVSKVLAKLGLDINFKTTRDNILKDNPRADQMVIVLTMGNTFCQMIWSDPSLSGADKAAKFQAMTQEMMSRVLGPVPVARTDASKQSRFDGPDRPVASFFGRPSLKFVVANEGKLPEPQTGFLRDAPFYVTDANKYFVIVGSARTREEGVRLMNKYKSKAPQYNFVLYEPYGDNPYFGVMMATWVPRDVAMEALRLARRDVVSDAYLWSCPGSGDSC